MSKKYKLSILIAAILLISVIIYVCKSPAQYTVIPYNYYQVVQQSERDISTLINLLKPYQKKPDYLNQLVSSSVQHLIVLIF